MSDFKWYYGPSGDCESYSGTCDTREEAISEVFDNGDPGDVWSILEAAPEEVRRMSASCILDGLMEAMLEDGFYGEDFDVEDVVACDEETWKAAVVELQETLNAWHAKHKGLFRKPWLFAATRNHEIITIPEAVS